MPIECVVRGYLAGSGWKEYQQSGTVCGIRLPAGLTESARLPEPIFTPATKAEAGHDENISFERMVGAGRPRAGRGAAAPQPATSSAAARSTPGSAASSSPTRSSSSARSTAELLLIDEVLTPDSSRFWPADQYAPGRGQPSFDKQFVRDWLSASGWDKNSPPPPCRTRSWPRPGQKYVEAYERLTGRKL